ncbi:MAG TPA: hypothetical protein VFA84_11895 [Acidimicrobiales bacterium]|nr:hypothetical protein [Acidimicrobiales bacterium]
MSRHGSRWAVVAAALGALVACSSSSPRSSAAPPSSTAPSSGPHVLLVGTDKGHAGAYTTIQAAVDAAKPGDWVLVAPGDYHEQYDHTAAPGDRVLGGVYITTPALHLRGMDRNSVIVDGTKPGAPACSRAAADQVLGPAGADGKPVGRNGIEVWKADGVSIDNLTACNFLVGGAGGGNEIWWNGGDGSGVVGLGAYTGSYLSATSTYAVGDTAGSYGLFVSNSRGPGRITHSYASNMADASFYVGACADCNAVLDDVHGQYSALGYSGTNAGGHLIVENSEFDQNKTGFTTNSQNNDDAPSPQDGACPGGGTGPTGTHSCWVFEHNDVHDNNNANVPGRGTAELAFPGAGIIIAGGRNDTVVDNRFERNGSWAVAVVPFPDTGTPPPVAHCVGGDPGGVPTLGLKGCFYADWGNEIAHNTFVGNGGFGNPTNGDIADISDSHNPGNCWHDNSDSAGLTSAPTGLEQTNGTCGAAGAGAALTSPLAVQAICAAEILAPCPPKPGMNYPRSSTVTLPALAPQTTMPDPCAGVPANPWCPAPARSSVPLGLIGAATMPVAAAVRRRRPR